MREGRTVASGSADLLVDRTFDGARERGVDDGADVGFVDAHAEGDGGDDRVEFAGEEAGLCVVAYGWV